MRKHSIPRRRHELPTCPTTRRTPGYPSHFTLLKSSEVALISFHVLFKSWIQMQKNSSKALSWVKNIGWKSLQVSLAGEKKSEQRQTFYDSRMWSQPTSGVRRDKGTYLWLHGHGEKDLWKGTKGPLPPFKAEGQGFGTILRHMFWL